LVYIAKSVNEAIKEYNKAFIDSVRIYTNRSSINSYIGAAAVAPAIRPDSSNIKRLQYISISATSTIYSAELRGLVLALEILLEMQTAYITIHKYTIFTNN
jgi:ribonuclease HI